MRIVSGSAAILFALINVVLIFQKESEEKLNTSVLCTIPICLQSVSILICH